MRERRRYNWKTTQRNLINLVRAYKICDMTRDKTLTEQTWDKISEVLGISAFRCRRMWFSISTIYKRLKLMIIDGELTEMEVRMNYKVAKYLNGMLDFVDPWFTSAHTKQIIKVKNHLATKRTLSILLGYDIDNGSNICSGEIKLSEDPFGRK
ncbi:hypothetical protein HW555_007626 [Spodoptera exigua]|uniref:MADF domain-containing protein n=1 Tax=Spodoptera exigua TaxID=7107 RepID=A0A835L2H7_SPOEX|nr:hypothetical protein HW555_007626 [Spodoptera exigua]